MVASRWAIELAAYTTLVFRCFPNQFNFMQDGSYYIHNKIAQVSIVISLYVACMLLDL
jgi:hypothetical protein